MGLVQSYARGLLLIRSRTFLINSNFHHLPQFPTTAHTSFPTSLSLLLIGDDNPHLQGQMDHLHLLSHLQIFSYQPGRIPGHGGLALSTPIPSQSQSPLILSSHFQTHPSHSRPSSPTSSSSTSASSSPVSCPATVFSAQLHLSSSCH